MQAIIPNRPLRVRSYAWDSVTVNPNPPRVGEMTRIGFPLANPGPGEMMVERIEVSVAAFGMGVPWEHIGTLGPISLPPNPRHVEEAFVEWTPTHGGHRCVRAQIHVRGERSLLVGRNLDVIEAGADESSWRLPFHLGNPERQRAPIVLRMETEDDAAALHAMVRVGARMVRAGQPIWLEPGEVVPAEMRLAAAPGPALAAVQRVEAWIGERLIDGIQVTVSRPAMTNSRVVMAPDDMSVAAMIPSRELVAAG